MISIGCWLLLNDLALSKSVSANKIVGVGIWLGFDRSHKMQIFEYFGNSLFLGSIAPIQYHLFIS